MGNILIVDDDPSLRRALRERLEFWGHAAMESKDGPSALTAAEEREFDLILLDLSMPQLGGEQVLRTLRERGCGADIVILTAHGSIESAVESLKAGAADFLLKPADFDLLRRTIDRLLEKRQLQRVNLALTERLSEKMVTGESAAITALLETAAQAARSNATVLVTGESGCGKQVLSEYIHRMSPRSAGPFVYINCVALSDDLIESTLFGHEKGAFTGAVSRKDGRLEAAVGGTAFLDEVGDISPRLQAKLLHFLETNEFERVGGTRTIRIDCRIIAATNRDLQQAVRAHSFRQDLFFRLNVIRLEVPPLRERPEDIPVLAEAFRAHFARELGRGEIAFSPQTLRILEDYAWPGNVRELRNVIERMVVLARGDALTPELLPIEIRAGRPPAMAGEDGPLPRPGVPVLPDGASLPSFKEAVRGFKRDYLRYALERNGGNQTRTAEQLGLQRTFLNRLLRELED
jgi:DNA-binding NtrC family response regulator